MECLTVATSWHYLFASVDPDQTLLVVVWRPSSLHSMALLWPQMFSLCRNCVC